MNTLRYLVTFGFTFFILQTSFAQIPLEVSTTVLYPYPTQYSVWASESESFMVTVVNNSNTQFEFFIRTELMGTDFGNQETYIRISEDYRPVSGFTLAPGEAMTYSSSEIQETYANLGTDDIIYSDNIPIEDINGELPAGEYRICTQVLEYTENIMDIPVPLSPIDCSDFFTAGQASIQLIAPDEFISLSSEVPNTFHWTVSGIDFNDAMDYSYQLEIYEIDPIQAAEESIYDLVADGAANVFHIFEPVSELMMIVDPTLGSFPFEEEKTYAAQVTVVQTGGILWENNGKSNIMIYNSEPSELIVPLDDGLLTENQADCFENCHYTLDGNTNLMTADNPTSFEVGNFTMTEVEISNHNNDKYSGTGRIAISWLNDIFIKVNFNAIKINSDGRMIDGIVRADKFSMPEYLEEAANLLNTTRMIGGTLGANAAIDLPVGIDQNIGGFNLTVAITDLEFSPTDCYANTACNFHIPALGEDSWISLETTEICMHPGGFGNEFIMHMGPDRPINSHGDILVNIKGSESSDPDEVKQEACYLEMDCNGIKALSVKAEINFPKNMMVPDPISDQTEEEFVKGNFGFTIDLTKDAAEDVYAVLGGEDDNLDKGLHFLAQIDIDPFQIKGVPGWGFEMSEVWWDASEVSNVENIIMPEDHAELIDGNLPNAWTGFYLKKGTIAMPNEIFGTEGRPQLDINHGIIDPTFSMNISIQDILSNIEGNIDGWGISMDSLFMTINQNKLTEGGFSGQLRFPLADKDQYLRYTAIIGETSDEYLEAEGLGYTFNVSPDSTLTFPFMISEVYMAPDSYVEGGYITGDSGSAYFDSFITGGVNIDSKMFSTRDDYAGIEFQDFKVPFVEFGFKYHSSNGFSETHFGLVDDGSELDSEEGEMDFSGIGYGPESNKESLSGLPISINSFNIANDETGGQKFIIEPVISLSPGETGFAADAIVEILSSTEFTDYKQIKLTGFRIPGIGIDIERMGMGFSGSLEIYNDKNASGVGAKGVRGELAVALPLGVGMEMAADFGSVCMDSTAIWNSEKNFPYWYFDGMIYFGETGGIPIAGPIGLYGIGGGIQYNMSRSLYSKDPDEKSEEVAAELAMINVNDEIAAGNDVNASTLRRTTTTPAPSFGTYGLKMAGTIATCPSAAALNMDISVLAEFTTGDNMALSLLSIDGDAFLMTPLGQRYDPQVWAGVSLTYSNPGPGEYVFDGQFIAYANVRPAGISLLRGVGPGNLVGDVNLHASNWGGKSEWWLHIGNPDKRCGLEIGFEDILEVSAGGYFMLGHNLPTELPVPEDVAFMFGDKNKSGGNKLTSGTIDGAQERGSTSIKNASQGKGLAFGLEADVTIDIDQFGVYAALKVFLGFDINITQNVGLFCSNTGKEIGVNGWYGQGQIYAGLQGGLGFRVRALGKNHDLELFGLSAAVMLSGGGPNPFYADGRVGVQIRVLGGLIKCSKTISAEVGEKCVPYYPNPFGSVPIIAETYPVDGDTDVSHFAQPQISFTLPMDEITEISLMDADGNFGPYWVEPYFENVQIINQQGNQFPIDEELLLKKGKLLKLDKGKSFLSQKEYSVKLTIKAKEYPDGPNGNSQPVKDFGQEWKLDTMFTFSVGDLTDINELIEFAVPLEGQRYFLQDQVYATKLNFIEPHSEAFKQDNESYSYDYFVRYLDEDGNDPIEISIPDPQQSSSLDWILPEFENDKHYCMQLIRKKTANKFLDMVQGQIVMQDFKSVDLANSVISKDTIDLGEAINPVDNLGAGEMALITYFFKTSKYNTLSEKMDGAKSYYNNDFQWQTDILTLDTDENFDEFDVKGLKEQSQTILEPLIRLFDPMEEESQLAFSIDYTDYYKKQLVDKTKVFLDKIEAKGIENPITDGAYVTVYLPDFPEQELKYLDANAMHRQVIDYDPPLNDGVIARFAENEYTGMFDVLDLDFDLISSNIVDQDVKLEFTTFDKANEDGKKLYEWGEDVSANPLALEIITMTPDYALGYGYKKFVDHYTALSPYSLFDSRNYLGDIFYLDVYHGNFIRTPISTSKGSNKQKIKFEVE